MNSIFVRDSTAVSDSVLILFGGSVSKGDFVSFSAYRFFACASVTLLTDRTGIKFYRQPLVFGRMATSKCWEDTWIFS